MNLLRHIEGIPYKKYKTVGDKKTARRIAEHIRQQGYYVRLKGTREGIEIWVSMNPRWFYRFGR